MTLGTFFQIRFCCVNDDVLVYFDEYHILSLAHTPLARCLPRQAYSITVEKEFSNVYRKANAAFSLSLAYLKTVAEDIVLLDFS